MAKYSPLDDGSYLVDIGGRPVRTAVDPVDYGYESDPDYAPKPPSQEERLARVASTLDSMRRESDPEYRAIAEEQDRQKEYEQQQEQTRRLGEGIQRDQEEAPAHLQPTAELTKADAGKFFGDETRTDAAPAAMAKTGRPSVAELQAAEGIKPTQEGRTRVVVPQKGPERIDRSGAPVATPGTGQRDPTRDAISDLVAGQIVKRSGPTKGGWVPTQVTTQREGVPDPAALAQVESAARDVDRIGLEQIESRAQAMREKVIAPQLTALESDARSLQASYQERKRTDERLAELQKAADDKERAADEMPRINGREDYWADKGIFAKILAALSMGAFQFGQGLAGTSGPNIPLELTEAAIAENSELLRQEHEDAQTAGKKARNAYSEALATYGDKESAMKALRLEGQALTDRMKGLQLAQYGSDQERAEWETQKAQRRETRAREYADLSAKAAGSTVSAERYVAPSSGGSRIDPRMAELWMKLNPGASGEHQGSELRQRESENERLVWLPPQLQKRLGIDGRSTWAADKGEAVLARQTMNVAEKGLRAIEELEKIYATSAFELNPDLLQRIEANAGVVQSLVGQKPLGLSQQTEGEFTRITDALRGDQGAKAFRLDSEGKESLRKAKELFLQDMEHHTRGLSKKPWELDYVAPDVK
jgi:hypothetical protein